MQDKIRIELKSIELINFKNITQLKLELDKKESDIIGKNGSGKSTVYDAFTWLLIDKDSKGNSPGTNFKIKRINSKGVMSKDDSKVKAVFKKLDEETSEIEELTLEKVYVNKYKKEKDGTYSENGYSSSYFVDGVQLSKKEYENLTTEYFSNTNVINLLTNVYSFANLKWKDKRDLLVKLIHTYSDLEIIDLDSSLKDLRPLVEKKKSDLNALLETSQRKVKKALSDLSSLDIKIEENTSLKVCVDKDTIEAEIKALQNERENLFKTKEAIASNDDFEKNSALSTLSDTTFKVKSYIEGIENKLSDTLSERNKHLAEIRTKALDLRNEVETNEHVIKGLEKKIQINKELIQDLSTKWKNKTEALNQSLKEKTENIPHVCPLCKKPFTDKERQDSKIDIINAIKEEGQKAIQEINKQGFELKKETEELIKKKEALLPTLENAKSELSILENRLKEAETHVIEIKDKGLTPVVMIKNFANKEGYVINYIKDLKANKIDTIMPELLAPIQNVEKALITITEAKTKVKELDQAKSENDKFKAINQEIADVEEKINALQKELGKASVNAEIEHRIEKFKKDQEDIQEKLQETRILIDLIERFNKKKMETYESSINQEFNLVKFKLFDKLANGSIVESCEITVDNIPYNNLNTASKVNAGIDIINTISKNLGIYLPLFIDARESVTNIEEIDTQIINLVVNKDSEQVSIK